MPVQSTTTERILNRIESAGNYPLVQRTSHDRFMTMALLTLCDMDPRAEKVVGGAAPKLPISVPLW